MMGPFETWMHTWFLAVQTGLMAALGLDSIILHQLE